MIIEGYPWAQNRSKLQRAICEASGGSVDNLSIGDKKFTEDDVKVIYIRLLGVVLDIKDGVAEEPPEIVKRRGRRKK